MTTWKELMEQHYLPGPNERGVAALRKVLDFQRAVARARRRVPAFATLLQFLSVLVPGVDQSPLAFRAALEYASLWERDWAATLDAFAAVRAAGLDLGPWLEAQDVFHRFYHQLTKVDRGALESYVRTVDVLDSGPKILFADSWYYVADRATTLAILEAFPYESLPYLAERRDCDDFARMLKAWLSRQGLGNLAVGEMWATFRDERDGRTVRFAHAVALAVYRQGEGFGYLIWEPQKEDVLYREEAGADDRGAFDAIEPYFVLF